MLTSAYRGSLQLAVDAKCRSIALPALSTGAYGYPLQAASRIALSTAIEFLQDQPGALDRVTFVLFGDEAFQAFATAMRELLPANT